MKYELRQDFSGHTQDVKAVSCFNNEIILSVSRDTTLRAWDLKSSDESKDNETIFLGHSKFVNCVKGIPPTPESPQGLYLSGGSDKVINVFNPSQPERPTYFMVGHDDNVVTLDIHPDGRIISGSWDKTARVWKNWNEQFVLRGHTQAVWAVKALRNNLIVTGSADKTIRLWDSNSGKCLKVIEAHNDCVRGIDEIPGLGFVSCGNDSVIKVWSYEGELIQELFGHTSFIYSVAVIPGTTDCFVSGGEDRSVRIWKGGVCVQSIMLPAISVWAVSAMPNGDIVCGTNDGHVRVFTQEGSRKANPSQIQAFEANVASQAVPSNQVGDINKDQLPDTSALLTPGKKEGEVRMVRSGAVVEAHQWDSAAQMWQKIGEVVDAVGQGRKQLHNGMEYDYVFDINIDDGAPNLKLPYNVTENPYTAAMNFIQKNELPVSYIDQVAEFITKNTKGETLGASAPTEQVYVDPYTGGSRYVAQNAPQAKATTSHRFPIREMLTFKQANVEAIINKLTQLNSTLSEESRLDDAELAALHHLTTSPEPTSPGLESLLKVIKHWPISSRFPALDLLRFLTTSVSWYNVYPIVPLLDLPSFETGVTKDQDVIIMLTCRLVSNLIAVAQETVQKSLKDITHFVERVGQQVSCLSPNARVAFFSVLVNISVFYIGKADAAHDDNCIQYFLSAMSALVSSIESPPSIPNPAYHEANFRALVAIGNMFNIHTHDGRDLAEISQLLPALRNLAAKKAEHDPKVSTIAEEISSAFLS